jgi:hypothetical protein
MGITAGPDGNVWFTEPQANQIGMITPDGQITEFQVPTPNSQPGGITTGPDGNIWFTELGSGQIGEFILDGGGSGPARSAALAQAARSGAVDGFFARPEPDLRTPIVVNQHPAPTEANAPGSQRRAEAGSVSLMPTEHLAVTHDILGLSDPLMEAL